MPYEQISAQDRLNRLTISGIWELPFGNGWCEIGVCRPQESQTVDTVNNVIKARVYGFSKWGKLGPDGIDVFLPLILKNGS